MTNRAGSGDRDTHDIVRLRTEGGGVEEGGGGSHGPEGTGFSSKAQRYTTMTSDLFKTLTVRRPPTAV